MSQANVEIVRRIVEAFNRRDEDAVVAALKNCEWEDALFLVEGRRIYRGEAQIREWWKQLWEPFEELHLQLGETISVGDRVLAEAYLSGRGQRSGVDVPQWHYWNVCWFTDGELARRQLFQDRAEALEAAGLSE